MTDDESGPARGEVIRSLRAIRRSHGLVGVVSELLYLGARATAQGKENAVFQDPREVRQKLRQARENNKYLRASVRRQEAKKKSLAGSLQKLRNGVVKDLKRSEQRLSEKLKLQAVKIENLRTSLRSLRGGSMAFYSSESLASQVCPACRLLGPDLAPYPHPQTHAFAKVITCWCRRCGFGWVPGLPFDLSDYYRDRYASENRGDRDQEPAKYFEELGGGMDGMRPGLRRLAERAKFQLAMLEEFLPPDYRMLDFGSGPGYALFFSRAKEKHAIELDRASEKYLDYLGATRVQIQNLAVESYDAILSSHSLEHLEVGDLFPTLQVFHRALKEGGILLLEVPNGSLREMHLPRRHEPHTLFFNPLSLASIVRSAGFDVLQQISRETGHGLPLVEKLVEQKNITPANADGMIVLARKGPATSPASLPTVTPVQAIPADPSN